MCIETFLMRYEVLRAGFGDMVESELRLRNYDFNRKRELVLAILGLMGRSIGGMAYFYGSVSKEETVNAWVDRLGDFRPQCIFEGVEKILDGYYERRGDLVPRNVLEFVAFLKSPVNNSPPLYVQKKDCVQVGFDKEGAFERKRERADEFFRKIHLQLLKNRCKVQAHKEEKANGV